MPSPCLQIDNKTLGPFHACQRTAPLRLPCTPSGPSLRGPPSPPSDTPFAALSPARWVWMWRPSSPVTAPTTPRKVPLPPRPLHGQVQERPPLSFVRQDGHRQLPCKEAQGLPGKGPGPSCMGLSCGLIGVACKQHATSVSSVHDGLHAAHCMSMYIAPGCCV